MDSKISKELVIKFLRESKKPYTHLIFSLKNFEKFIDGDPFNLVQLVVLFDTPDLTYLLDEIDIKKITPFGWEKLLISRPDKFSAICDFTKLNEANWAVILYYSPQLISYKI